MDVGFVREGNFGLQPIIENNRKKIKAKIVMWNSGHVIEAKLKDIAFGQWYDWLYTFSNYC